MSIRVWEYLDEYNVEKEEIQSAINEVLSSGQLILGPNVRAFESKFADYCGVSYGVGVNSGTDALFLALKALNVGEGDEVITVSNTAVPTVSAIVSTGARTKFVDIDSNTYLMDSTKIEEVITHKTKCILPVHLFGQCVEMDSIINIAEKFNLYVLEDCAQSHGATFNGKRAGSMGDLAAFSFYPTKILGGYGDGGMVVTNNESLYKKILRLRFYGMETTYYSIEHGYNSRLDEIHAAILLKKLTHLDKYLAERKRIAKEYFKNLNDTDLVLPKEHNLGFHSFYLFVCRHKKRDTIILKLADKGIKVNISYPWPIHTMKGYEYLGYKEGDLPNTETAAKEIFSLPMFPSLTFEKQMVVIESIKEILSDLA
jgi:dTDP-3-amino-2,3,6-trideoxy-4-keto-D-glucose/dTDP-3-amino-3,4,6-trideoxy-alpha-D-glucose/dTDP-2,6-dideoxy-D-kanosamine transaminase